MISIDKIIIRRPRIEEIDLINDFFTIMLKHTFDINKISEIEELEEEIGNKKRYINQDLETKGMDRFFLVAEFNDEIIGTIEYGASSDFINKCTNNEFVDMLEIGTVFVHPKYQGQGIASLLLYDLFQELFNKGVKEICLDSGYKAAQGIWCRKFGHPEYCLENYWDQGNHHMIWKVNIDEALELFNLNSAWGNRNENI